VTAATQVYYASFDAVFLKLPAALRVRIETKIDEIVGDYRIIYTFDLEQNAIHLLAIGHRREIYRGVRPLPAAPSRHVVVLTKTEALREGWLCRGGNGTREQSSIVIQEAVGFSGHATPARSCHGPADEEEDGMQPWTHSTKPAPHIF
jgi:hypothetical protein